MKNEIRIKIYNILYQNSEHTDCNGVVIKEENFETVISEIIKKLELNTKEII